MGLNATVYADEECSRKLTSLRIGNASTVFRLAELIRAVKPDSRTLLGKVLYSGTHSGDKLDLDQIEIALAEIQRLKVISLSDSDLQLFLHNFEQLLSTAFDKGLPVVF